MLYLLNVKPGFSPKQIINKYAIGDHWSIPLFPILITLFFYAKSLSNIFFKIEFTDGWQNLALQTPQNLES